VSGRQVGDEVQATVRTHDPATRDTTVLLDDGARLDVQGRAVQTEVRFLRPGQRVRLRREGALGEVRALTLAGLPLRP